MKAGLAAGLDVVPSTAGLAGGAAVSAGPGDEEIAEVAAGSAALVVGYSVVFGVQEMTR